MTTTIHAAGLLPGRPSKKGLLRRPTLTRKRDDREDSNPLSPSKKSKVTFDSDVEVRVVEEWEKTLAVVNEEVQQALRKHSFGDDRGYNRIKEIFSPEEGGQGIPSHSTIMNYTLALANNTSLLGKSSSDLVHIVLNCEWLVRPDDYIQTFQRLLANLITAQGSFLADVFRMLIENMATCE